MPEKIPHEATDDEVRARSPLIETDRLRLRLFQPQDLDELASMFSDPQVMRYVADGKPAGRDVAEKALTSGMASAVGQRKTKRHDSLSGLVD